MRQKKDVAMNLYLTKRIITVLIIGLIFLNPKDKGLIFLK